MLHKIWQGMHRLQGLYKEANKQVNYLHLSMHALSFNLTTGLPTKLCALSNEKL
jgi:hypothetical protein